MLNITAPHFTREKVCISSEACLQLEFPLMLPPSQQKMSKPICVTLGFVSADEHNSVGVENLIQKSFVLHVDVETPGPQTTAMVLYSPVPAKCNKVFIKKRGIDIAEKKWKKESECLWEQIHPFQVDSYTKWQYWIHKQEQPVLRSLAVVLYLYLNHLYHPSVSYMQYPPPETNLHP
jgi:hypothetical protein